MSDNNEPFGNTDWINDENTLSLLPPTIQWYRGDLKDKDKRVKQGCWELQADSFEAILGDTIETVDVLHSGGKIIRAYLFEKLHISVLAWKKRWYIETDRGIRFVEYQEGAKSKLQYYCLVKELGNETAMVSVTSLNAKHLTEASLQFRKKILQPAMQMGNRTFGQHHFWMPLASQGKMDTKQNQYITPPGLVLPEITPEIIKGLFLGAEAGQLAESLIPQAKAWASHHKETLRQEQSAGNGQGMPEPPPNFYDDEMPEPDLISEDEIPF